MPAEVLSRLALNRALLDTADAAEPAPAPGGRGAAGAVIEMVEHLAGLQAQAPFPPYYGLWSRLAGFRPGDLAELLVEPAGGPHRPDALHDPPGLRPRLPDAAPAAPAGARPSLAAVFGKQLAGVDTGALAEAGRALVEPSRGRSANSAGCWPSTGPATAPNALAQGVRAWCRWSRCRRAAVWGAAGQAGTPRPRPGSAARWTRRAVAGRPGARYLAAFGPATVADVQAWSGLTRLGEVVERLRPRLRDVPRRARQRAVRPAGRAAARPGTAGAGAPGRRVRQPAPLPRRPRPGDQPSATGSGCTPATASSPARCSWTASSPGCGGSPGPAERRR